MLREEGKGIKGGEKGISIVKAIGKELRIEDKSVNGVKREKC